MKDKKNQVIRITILSLSLIFLFGLTLLSIKNYMSRMIPSNDNKENETKSSLDNTKQDDKNISDIFDEETNQGQEISKENDSPVDNNTNNDTLKQTDTSDNSSSEQVSKDNLTSQDNSSNKTDNSTNDKTSSEDDKEKDDNNQENKTSPDIKNEQTKQDEPTSKDENKSGNKDEDNKQSPSNPSSLSIENDNLRQKIKSQYNVSIGYKDEIDELYHNDYANPLREYDETKINSTLKTIDSALKKYPSSFFTEIKTKCKPLTIYLVSKINDYAAGLTDNQNPSSVVILISTGQTIFESTLHHEIMHYIDCYLANLIGASALENSMNNLNPTAFSYGDQSNKYVNFYDTDVYFLSTYSKSNYKEDRATIFADMMFRSLKKDYYQKGKTINNKAQLISSQLEKYLDCVTSTKKEHWNRFVEW